VFPDKAGGGQVQDHPLGDLGIEAPVKLLQGLHLRQPRLLEAASQKAVSALGQLVLHQQFQELGIGQLVMDGLLVACRQSQGHARQTQMAQLALQFRVHSSTS
jgi:hypothetical protein